MPLLPPLGLRAGPELVVDGVEVASPGLVCPGDVTVVKTVLVWPSVGVGVDLLDEGGGVLDEGGGSELDLVGVFSEDVGG